MKRKKKKFFIAITFPNTSSGKEMHMEVNTFNKKEAIQKAKEMWAKQFNKYVSVVEIEELPVTIPPTEFTVDENFMKYLLQNKKGGLK